MKKILISLIICLNIIQLNAQTDSLLVKKNVIKLNATVFPDYFHSYSVAYERNIFAKKWLKLNVEADAGVVYSLCNKVWYHKVCKLPSFSTSVNTLFGRKSHYFEINTGVRYFIFCEEEYNYIFKEWMPVLNLGYRYQNPKGRGLVFRTFIGLFGVGISVGKSF